MIKFKQTLIVFGVFLLPFLVIGQDKEDLTKDIWSGRYRVAPVIKDSLKKYAPQYFIIERSKDANPEDLAVRYQYDLMRWTIKLESQPDGDKREVKRFLFHEDDNAYEEFNWTQMHKEDKMHCIDGGNFFICQTTSNSTITFGDEEFYTDSGIFGIRLHYGAFQLYKVE